MPFAVRPSTLAAPMTQISLSRLLGPAYQSVERWSSCSPSMSSDRRGRRRSETDGSPHGGSASPTTHSNSGSSAHSPTTPGALSQHRDHWRCSPAAQRKLRLAGSLLGGTAAATRPARGPSAAPAATCPDKAWDFQHQSCLETTRDYATVSSKSPCLNLNLGARHFVPQCCLPSVSIFFCPFTDDGRPRPCLAVFERHATTSGGRFALVARYLESGI